MLVFDCKIFDIIPPCLDLFLFYLIELFFFHREVFHGRFSNFSDQALFKLFFGVKIILNELSFCHKLNLSYCLCICMHVRLFDRTEFIQLEPENFEIGRRLYNNIGVYFNGVSFDLRTTSDLRQIRYATHPTYQHVVLRLLFGLVAAAPCLLTCPSHGARPQLACPSRSARPHKLS